MTDYTADILSYLVTRPRHCDVRPLINACLLTEQSMHDASAKMALALQLAQLAEQRFIKFEACFLQSIIYDTQTPILISITSKGKKQYRRKIPGLVSKQRSGAVAGIQAIWHRFKSNKH
ncbi:MAG: hypothetical protein ACTHLE_08020 [Agriterribacter sp.]